MEEQPDTSPKQPLNEEIMQQIYAWVDEIPLTRPKRNITRDFSDGVMAAELVKHFFPKIVELHNYSTANSIQHKLYNWNTLNQKVFRKLNFGLTKTEIDAVCNCAPGAIERILLTLKSKIEAKIAYKNSKHADSELSTPHSPQMGMHPQQLQQLQQQQLQQQIQQQQQLLQQLQLQPNILFTPNGIPQSQNTNITSPIAYITPQTVLPSPPGTKPAPIPQKQPPIQQQLQQLQMQQQIQQQQQLQQQQLQQQLQMQQQQQTPMQAKQNSPFNPAYFDPNRFPANSNTPSGNGQEPDYLLLLEKKDQTIKELQSHVDNLQSRIMKLEQIARIRESKIQKLTQKLQQADIAVRSHFRREHLSRMKDQSRL